jgi:hypothetical protein
MAAFSQIHVRQAYPFFKLYCIRSRSRTLSAFWIAWFEYMYLNAAAKYFSWEENRTFVTPTSLEKNICHLDISLIYRVYKKKVIQWSRSDLKWSVEIAFSHAYTFTVLGFNIFPKACCPFGKRIASRVQFAIFDRKFESQMRIISILRQKL